MAGDNAKELEHYKALLRRQELTWRSQFERVLHSDRAAMDIGLVALKTAILVNAGAVVALLAFVGQLWSDDVETLVAVLRGAGPFVCGLVAAVLAAGIAYIYQSFITAVEARALADVSEGAHELKPQKWFPRFAKWAALAMIGLVLLSYGLFMWGALRIVAVLGH